MSAGTKRKSSRWQLVGIFVFGIVFLTTMLVVAIRFPVPTEFQLLVFRVVLALSAAGVGAIVPGFITVTLPHYIRAGGALALFVIVFRLNPPALVSAVPPSGLAVPSQSLAVPSSQSTVGLPEKPSEIPSRSSASVVPPARPKKIKPQSVQASQATTAQVAPGPGNTAMLQELRQRMMLLTSRATALRGNVEHLERQQQQAGLSLRPDIVAAKERSQGLLAAGDAAATKSDLDLAEQQVEKLEHFLGG